MHIGGGSRGVRNRSETPRLWRRAYALPAAAYSHSIVPGGFEVTS